MKTKKQGRPKSEEKYKLILHTASQLFLQTGFANTSMDAVAKASGVSKQTVYSHFESKDALFKAAISSKCSMYQRDSMRLSNSTSHSLYDCLCQVGSQFIRLLQDPQSIAIFRVIIAEAVTNSHVATLFYQAGPQASQATLSELIAQFGEGALSAQIAHELAIDFCSLLRSEHHTMMLCGIQSPMNDEEIDEHVKRVVDKTLLLFSHFKLLGQNA